jgi:GT2 family glycosyltransferase
MFYNLNLEFSTRLKNPLVGGMCCAYKKIAFEKAGGFREGILLEDFDLSERISKFGKVKLNKNVIVLTSPRRIEKWGSIKTIYNYLNIYLNYLIRNYKRPKEYEPIR